MAVFSWSFLAQFLFLVASHTHQESLGLLQQARIHHATTSVKQALYWQVYDPPGFNNLRLLLENAVSVAAVTGRTLVLPTMTRLGHTNVTDFAIGNVWNLSRLGTVISVELPGYNGYEMGPGCLKKSEPATRLFHDQVYWTRHPITDFDFRNNLPKVPSDKGWDIGCPGWRFGTHATDEQKEVAKNAVSQLRFQDRFAKAAYRKRHLAGLKQGGYIGIHLRKGDFVKSSIYHMPTGKKLAEAILATNCTESLPVLVATDADKDDPIFKDLSHTLSNDVKFTSDLYSDEDGDLDRVLLDMLMLADAKYFLGTSSSSFSEGIMDMRENYEAERHTGYDLERRSVIPGQDFKSNGDRSVCCDLAHS